MNSNESVTVSNNELPSITANLVVVSQITANNREKKTPIRCYTCNKEGHNISTRCPEKRTVANCVAIDLSHKNKKYIIDGVVNEAKTKILLDNGADIGLVPHQFVPKANWLNQTCVVLGIHGGPKTYNLAQSTFMLNG